MWTVFVHAVSCLMFPSAQLSFMSTGPVLAFELVGENAVQRWQEIIGPADPAKARSEAASSLRARFGKGNILNAVT